jgi:hypothetical protein
MCPSCGTRYTDHVGLIGTCYEKQLALSAAVEAWCLLQRIDSLVRGRTALCDNVEWAGEGGIAETYTAWHDSIMAEGHPVGNVLRSCFQAAQEQVRSKGE